MLPSHRGGKPPPCFGVATWSVLVSFGGIRCKEPTTVPQGAPPADATLSAKPTMKWIELPGGTVSVGVPDVPLVPVRPPARASDEVTRRPSGL